MSCAMASIRPRHRPPASSRPGGSTDALARGEPPRMVDVAGTAPGQAQPARSGVREALSRTEIDLRLFGMLAALAVILIGFHIMSGGTFLKPANMVTLAVQASGTAIMATGMFLIIVSRNIDLSVGSIVGVV